MYLPERKHRLSLRLCPLLNEIVAAWQATQHTEVAPAQEAEREDFFKRMVIGEQREEIEELAVG